MKLNYLFILLVNCRISSAQTALTQLKGNYLGQKPPGMHPELFAPGIISTKYYEHSAPAFSPDGKTVLWTVIYERGKPARIMEMLQKNGVWTKPAPAGFADTTADDFYPSFSADGKMLYFSSRRKLPEGYPPTPGMIRLWKVKKKSSGWGTPSLLDTAIFKKEIYYHSITKKGIIYASRRGQGGRFDIACYKRNGGRYLKPEVLPYNINSRWSEDGAFISPDESYLIFESARPGGIEGSTDLYISFRRKDGTWSIARNMGPNVNSKFAERFAWVSPDGKYLFFGSDRNPAPGAEGADIYWVDAKVIDVLRKEELREHEKSIDKDGKDLRAAMDHNDDAKSAALLRNWLAVHPKDVNGYNDFFSALRRSGQYAAAEKEIKNRQAALPDNADLKTELALINYGLDKNEEAEKILATMPAQTIADRARFTAMAAALYSMKKYKESAAQYEVALKIQPRAIDFYNLACSCALQGDKDKAFEALLKAVDNGYNEKEKIETDPDLVSLLADPRWNKLQEKLVSKLPPGDPKKPNKRAQ